MMPDLECFLEKIRDNALKAEGCIKSGKYGDSIEYMKLIIKDDSEFVFPELKIKECCDIKFEAFKEMNYCLMNLNGNDIKAVFRKQKYGLYHYMAKLISLPLNCSAPSLFEEVHHSLQHSALPKNMELMNYYNFNGKNGVMEQCAYYWRIMIFPENKKKKDKIILPDNFENMLKKSHEEIIGLEKSIIY
jgi:hypothetical protein